MRSLPAAERADKPRRPRHEFRGRRPDPHRCVVTRDRGLRPGHERATGRRGRRGFRLRRRTSRSLRAFRQLSPDAPPTTVRLQSVPELGERAYATVSSPQSAPGTPPAAPTVSLQVLKGTVSFGLSRQAPPQRLRRRTHVRPDAPGPIGPKTGRGVCRGLPRGFPAAGQPDGRRAIEPDAQPAVGVTDTGPTASRPAPQHQTPEQLARLLQGITGPSGSPAHVLEGRYAPTAPAAPPGPSAQSCTYDDAAYLASLGGAATLVAEIPGTGQAPDQISLRLISLPALPPDASAFDRRAADLGSCTSVQERVPGGAPRTWSPLKHPTVDTSGQTGYAVVYMLPDGTDIRHVLSAPAKETCASKVKPRHFPTAPSSRPRTVSRPPSTR